MMTVRRDASRIMEVIILSLSSYIYYTSVALVSFDQLMVTVNENEGNVEVCIVCMELPEREILITLESQNGTAQGKYSGASHYY